MNTNMLSSKIIAGVMLKVMNKLIPGLHRYFKVILLLFFPLTWSQTLAGEMSIVASGTWPACDCNDSNCYKAEVVSNGFKISGNGIVTQELLLMPSRVYSSYGASFQILDSNNNWGPWQWWGNWKDGCKGSWQVLENAGKDVKGEPYRSYTKYKVTNAECGLDHNPAHPRHAATSASAGRLSGRGRFRRGGGGRSTCASTCSNRAG